MRANVAAVTLPLKAREHRRAHLQHELDALVARDYLAAFDSAGGVRELRRRVDEWRALLTRNAPIARQVLDRLLKERINWTPRRDEGTYEYRGGVHSIASKGSSAQRNRRKATRASRAKVTERDTSPTGDALVGLAGKPSKLRWMLTRAA